MKRIVFRVIAVLLFILALGIFLSLRHISLWWGCACPALLCVGLEMMRLSNRPSIERDGEDNPEVEDEL